MQKKKPTHNDLIIQVAELEKLKDEIEKLRKSEKSLRKSEKKYRRLVEAIQERNVIYGHDMAGNFNYLSPSIFNVLGYTQEEFMGHYSEYMTDNPANSVAINFTDTALKGIKQRTYEAEYWHKNGSRVWLSTTERPVYGDDGKIQGIEGIVHDITNLKNLEANLQNTIAELQNAYKELANKKAYIESIYNSMADGIWVVDINGKTLDANNSMITMMGYKNRDKFLKIDPLDIVPEENKQETLKNIQDVIKGKTIPLELDLIRKDGAKLSISLIISPLRDSQKNTIGALAIIRDITEMKKAEERAFLDRSTGLINRKPFDELLEQTIEESKARNERCALFFITLKIKTNTHSIEHPIIDKLIVNAVSRIKSFVKSPNFIGRYGEYEFVICYKNIKSIIEILELSKKINSLFLREISIDKVKYDINSNIGISFYPKDGANAAELIKSGIIAMHNARKKGRNKSCLYNLKYKKSLDFNYSLEKAFKKKEFILYYQPIVDSKGNCVYIEALIRWNSPIYGLVSPLQFIELLEKNHQIIEVGLCIIKESAQTIKKINSIKGFEDIGVSINISITQLIKKDFYDRVKEILDKTGVNYNNINFEITETQDPYYNYSYIITVLERFKKLGINILLDDFGVGFSSLVNIIKFPIDIIKLDKFFLDTINKDSAFTPILSGVFYTAEQTNKKIIAEGIETFLHFNTLKNIKCDYFQGFFFSKPIPNIIEVLKKVKGNFMPDNLSD